MEGEVLISYIAQTIQVLAQKVSSGPQLNQSLERF